MTFQINTLRVAALLAMGATLLPAHATNGYFAHGYGIKSKGMGGAGLAVAQDGFGGANNPAQAVFAGDRLEGGVDLFMPKREMSRSVSPENVSAGGAKSGKNAFLMPEIGYNKRLSNDLAMGVTVYGNGGMNTTYPGGTTNCEAFGGASGSNALCGMGPLGVDLMQLVVAPTVAYQFSPNHALGLSPLLVYQQFSAYGLQMFQMTDGASTDPGALTNRGKDSSTGLGVRLGYLGKLSDTVSVGASYSPKINMSRFKKYEGLFAEKGGFDIPENVGVGLAVQVAPTVQLLADYNRINYSKVASVGNPAGFNMGAPDGGGFGWKDVDVIKLGVQWVMSPTTTLRMGFNRGTNPVTSNNITPNILAPGVMKNHLTIGGTHAVSPTSEISWSYMYAPSVSVTGPSMFNGMLPGDSPLLPVRETVKMRQMSIGLQYGMKF
jgi:long-chain fatty acid transport protein